MATGSGVAVAVTARSAFTLESDTFAVPVAEQPLLVTVTESETAPLEPAVNAIDGVPLPELIVPLVTDHVYVVPAGPAATEAALPLEFGSTDDGAVMDAFGVGFTVTTTGAEVALQLPLEIVTV